MQAKVQLADCQTLGALAAEYLRRVDTSNLAPASREAYRAHLERLRR